MILHELMTSNGRYRKQRSFAHVERSTRPRSLHVQKGFSCIGHPTQEIAKNLSGPLSYRNSSSGQGYDRAFSGYHRQRHLLHRCPCRVAFALLPNHPLPQTIVCACGTNSARGHLEFCSLPRWSSKDLLSLPINRECNA